VVGSTLVTSSARGKESKEVATLYTIDLSPGISLIQPSSTSPISTQSAEKPEFIRQLQPVAATAEYLGSARAVLQL